MHLWHHQQSIVTSSAERKQSDLNTESVWKNPPFIVSYWFIATGQKQNNMYGRDVFIRSLECYFGVFAAQSGKRISK